MMKGFLKPESRDNIPAQILKELPSWSIYVSAENLHTILPTSYPIHGFFFYPFLDNNGNIIRLFIIDDLKQSQGTTGLKEKNVDVVNNIIRIKDSREGLLDSRKMECIDGEVVVTVNEKLKDFRDREFNLLNAQISMVLYICSQINDIKEKNQFKRSEKHKSMFTLTMNYQHKTFGSGTLVFEWGKPYGNIAKQNPQGKSGQQ